MSLIQKSSLLALSNELIRMIVLHVVEPRFPYASYGRHLKDLTSISLVCSQLHHIVENTPQFWAYIVPRSKLQTITQLKKSSSCPLHIHTTILSQDLLPEIADLLASHTYRWQRGHFHHGHLDGLDLFHNPAPLLESLRVEIGLPGLTFDLFQGHAPKLHKLDIGNHCMSWDSGLLRGLTYLRLCAWDPHTKATPTSEQYLNMLTGCPNLEELHLYGRLGVPSLPPANKLQTDIQLTHLLHLSFTEIPAAIVQSFLCHIKASPQLIKVDITAQTSGNSVAVTAGSWMQEALEGVLIASPIKEVLLNPGELEIVHSNWTYSQFNIAATGKVNLPKLGISFIEDSIDSIQDVLPQTSYGHITSLAYYSGLGLDCEWLLAHLPDMPNLIHLELDVDNESVLEGDLESVCTILESLTSPYNDDAESAPHGCQWLCPRLEQLTLGYTEITCEDLIPFVEKRLDGHQANMLRSSTEQSLPVQLLRLTIISNDILCRKNFYPSNTLSDEAASKIAERMGQGFTWNGHYFHPSSGWEGLEDCMLCSP
ncbi:hypothetical protein FRC03_010351 [Tulasnella sp. 419]|nr:hypothetical protein FRC02_012476 [Tulasnella sp. 418]KAG8957230.1 hypothetical protein FRC03_010351 [Tulasnella sp. 419]